MEIRKQNVLENYGGVLEKRSDKKMIPSVSFTKPKDDYENQGCDHKR